MGNAGGFESVFGPGRHGSPARVEPTIENGRLRRIFCRIERPLIDEPKIRPCVHLTLEKHKTNWRLCWLAGHGAQRVHPFVSIELLIEHQNLEGLKSYPARSARGDEHGDLTNTFTAFSMERTGEKTWRILAAGRHADLFEAL